MYMSVCASRRRHTRFAVVTGGQTCALPICIDCGPFFISTARPASALGRRLMRLGEALAFERRLRVFARGRVGAIFVAIAVEVAHHIPAFLGGLDDREDVEIAR